MQVDSSTIALHLWPPGPMERVPEPSIPPLMPLSRQALPMPHNMRPNLASSWVFHCEEVDHDLGKLSSGHTINKYQYEFSVPRTFMEKHYPGLTSGSTLRLQVKVPQQNVMEAAGLAVADTCRSHPSATVISFGGNACTEQPALVVVGCVEARYLVGLSRWGARFQRLGGCLKSFVNWHAVYIEKVRV